jgi:glucose/arabinose dehydrogenase
MRLSIASLVFHFALPAPAALAATIPTGFRESLIASGLANPTAMQIAPDGRLFVCEQGGKLRVIKNGVLLSAPFVTLTVASDGERGLLGVAFDPAFATNQFVYVYYTATTPALHNRISRFTASGDVAAANSGVVIFDLDDLSFANNHNGGAIAFGPDGKLYAATGDNANSANSQSMTTVLGKMLRLNKDGTIPTDNPFYNSATGKNRAIWALGLRNPFSFAFNPAGPEMFINDVGEVTWEEIDDGRAGANYGWPETEGPTPDARFVSPRYSYGHSGSCAIVGGAFYSPLAPQFPSGYLNTYLFADYCSWSIRKLDLGTNDAVTFATGIPSPVDVKVASDGSLYYLARGSGATTGVVSRITHDASTAAPGITSHPADREVNPGTPVTFSVAASGQLPLAFQWQRNRINIAGATSPDYTITSVAPSDTGARFRAIVSNSAGSVASNEAVLTVSANQPPTGTITLPAPGTIYDAGMVVNYAGTATDPDEGVLPASAFTWQVDFHHDTHTHPFIQPTTGASSGSFTIPTIGHTEANVWYRIYLTVRDSRGFTHTTQRDILPHKVRLTFATSPPGLGLKLDGQPIATPLTVDAVVGIVRHLEAPSQTSGSLVYGFASWSDGGTATHDVSTPAVDTTYLATYSSTVSPPPPPPQSVSIWSSSTSPGPMASVTSPVQVGLKFRSDVSGSVVGLRFYKYAQNTGTHVGNLWTSTGTRLGTATFTGETASGWQQVMFPTPISIAANTTYVASYHTTTGRYAATPLGLANAVNNAPLHALASSSSGGNGVRAFGASRVLCFPTALRMPPTTGWTFSLPPRRRFRLRASPVCCPCRARPVLPSRLRA